MTPHRLLRLGAAFILASALASGVAAQPFVPSGARGIVDDPCPPPLAPPPELMQAMRNPNGPPPPAVAAFLAETNRRALTDWANLCRYAPDNATLRAEEGRATTAVFIGDSISEGWARADAAGFASNGYIGRGIAGQVSGQTLLRFQQDVVALRPRVAHILIGTNDVAGNAGPLTQADVQRNIMAMAQLAKVNGIAVVLGTVPPAADFPWRKGTAPAGQIIALNHWIRDYAKAQGIVLADYHAALADPAGGFRSEWSADGVHPNAEGYAVMAPIAYAAIRSAISASPRR